MTLSCRRICDENKVKCLQNKVRSKECVNLYYELLKKPIFTMSDAQVFYSSIGSARTAVKRLVDAGMASMIRKNLYTCISGETGAPVANRFQIASRITGTSYVTHHSAMEFYGITDQVFYDVYVASDSEFKSFSFDGYTFRYIKPRISEGVDAPAYSGGVHVTDRERTLLDSIKDMDRISGPEEVVANIESMRKVNEDKLVKYLSLYGNQFLYQKTGFLLSKLQDKLGLSESFFSLCQEKAGKSTRYLLGGYKTGRFSSEWGLVVPENLFQEKKGGMLNADV